MLFITNGCNQNPAPPEAAGNGPVRVLLQLNWLSDAQHGGFYAALAGGHYADAGLDVEILPGGPGTAVLPKVAMGRCDFAVANADQVLLARQQEADVVAVFASMQNSPRCIMVHESSGINSLSDLKNLTLALGDGKAFAEYIKSQVALEGVRIVSYTGTVAKFLIDDNFAQQGYVFSEPVIAAAQGGDPKALMVSELGFNPYSSIVVTRRELLDEQPELVEKFVQATQRGWQEYLASPDKANAIIMAANSEMTADSLAAAAQAISKLCKPEGFDEPIGSMRSERWTTLRNQLVEIGLLPEDSATGEAAFSAAALESLE